MSEDPENREAVDDTLEDAFGVNLRALRTLADLVIRPNAVFKSYAANDRVTYTPSIRLFVGLIAVQILISVIWGGYGGILLSQWQQPNVNVEALESLFGAPLEVVAEHYGNAAPFLHATVVGLFTALSAFLVGAFNRSLGWVARLNITFAVLSGGTIVGLLVMIIAALTDNLASISWAPFIIFFAYWLFFVRGAPGVLAESRKGAVLKGALFSVVTMLYVMLAGLVMALIAFIYAWFMIQNSGGA
ncbi:MAG: hypothetical protein DHS20C06_18100 [Hyphobacterium sp.]|nr:MAG: hypothetical protein DHS20C06_18100 [Hyphobacterium sp.]